MSIETNRGEGHAKELGGKLKKNVGKLVGNEQMEAEGAAKEAIARALRGDESNQDKMHGQG